MSGPGLHPNRLFSKKEVPVLYLLRVSRRTHDYLKENRMPHIFYVEPGGHDFQVWKNDLYHFSQLLFKSVDVAKFPDNPSAVTGK